MSATFSKLFPGQDSNSKGVRERLKNHLASLFTKNMAVDCFENKSQCYLFRCEQNLNISGEAKALPSHHQILRGVGASRGWEADLGRFPSLCKFAMKQKLVSLLSPRPLLPLPQEDWGFLLPAHSCCALALCCCLDSQH